MPRFGSTGKVLLKVSREVDAYQHIDRVREEVFEQLQRIEDLERDNKILKEAERKRITDTGVWRIVKGKLDAEAVDWAKWIVRAGLAGLGTAFLSLMAVVLRLAWKGLHA